MLKRLYNQTLNVAGHRHAPMVLFILAFTESSFFPIPPDVLLLPMILNNRDKAFYYATLCTVGSVLGGIAGYALGYFLFDVIGEPVLNFYGKQHAFEAFKDHYNNYGWWIVFGAGLTPIPYKVITIASGGFEMPIIQFLIASIVGRGMRFYLEAILLWKYGAPIRKFIEERFALVTTLAFVALIGGVLLLKML